MIRSMMDIKKIYLEGKREYYFIDHILRITNNVKKFQHINLGGGSHESMIKKVISDYFNGDKICIIDNSNRAKGQIPILESNKELLNTAKENNVKLIISKNQFDDEIIEFVNIPNLPDKNSKESIDQYLKGNNIEWNEYIKDRIKDKKYIKSNLDKIKNDDLKEFLSTILNSYKEDNYK
jgi:hypothetical protein